MRDSAELFPVRGVVLIAADDHSSRSILHRFLETEGHQVREATTGQSVIDWLDREQIDVVVLDMLLPGVGGLETCRRIRQHPRHSQVPILFVTRIEAHAERIEGKRAGGDDFIISPIEKTELCTRVQNLLLVRRYYLHLERDHASSFRLVAEPADLLSKAIAEVGKIHSTARQFHEELVLRMSKAVEYRDDETGNHVLRMSRYCGLIGRQMRLSDETCDAIRIASALHDVGKIGMPDEILRKPGWLNDDERLVMKRHADIGYKLLGGSKSCLLDLAARIAWTHHERFDGTGYPRGLAGEKIPLEGRMAALADVFDALTSKRVYKPAFPLEDAIEVLEEEKGKHFDPRIVEVFLKALSEAKEILSAFTDR